MVHDFLMATEVLRLRYSGRCGINIVDDADQLSDFPPYEGWKEGGRPRDGSAARSEIRENSEARPG
jgi:hypothetical protein